MIIAGVAVALALVGAAAPSAVRGIRLAGPLLAAGLASALAVGAVRASTLLDGPTVGLTIELWLLPGLAAALVWAGAAARRRDDRFLVDAGPWALVAAIATVTALECAAVLDGRHALVRSLVLACALAALHLATVVVDRAPLRRVVGWGSLAALAVTVLCAATTVHPIEAATLPLALALGSAGLVRLAEQERTRTWPQLGPGLAVLLVPSLVVGFSDPRLWRLVALGVLCVACVVFGVVRRWQALFLIASAVLLVHAVVQLWPWIATAYEAVPWWLWLGIGGALLIALAARYEHRLANVRSLTLTLRSFR